MRANPAGEPLVTAIVSTFAAERFLRGCLEDLLDQTIADRTEILVVDACSPQDEGAIVRAFQQSHGNVRYVRTATRVPTSVAFEHATALARGTYLTIANTDDRHHPEFLARMVQALEAHPESGLAYADAAITTVANETFARHSATRRFAWPDYTLPAALSCCLFGAQPLWRRSAHARAGGWDHALRRADDQDMFVRIAWRCGAVHVREPLGLFLQRPDSSSGSDNRRETLDEVLRVMRRHRTGIPLEDVFPLLRAHAGDPLARAAALFELGTLCARGPYTDAQLALQCWQQAAALAADDGVLAAGGTAAAIRAAFANNSAAVLWCAGQHDDAARAWRLCGALPEARHNERLAAAVRQGDAPAPRLTEFAFVELPHPVVAASRRTRGLVLDAAGRLDWSAWHEQRPWDVFDGPNGVPLAPARTAAAAPRRERVLLLQYGWADSGGGTILPREVARSLARRGHPVTVFHAAARREPSLPDYALRRWTEDGVDLVAVCNRPAQFMDLGAPDREVDDPRVRSPFEDLLAEFAPDVVHAFNLHNLGMSLPAACRARGVPVVYSSNNYWPVCPRLYLASERVELCAGPSVDGSRCERCLGQRGTAAAHGRRRAAGLAMLDGDVDVHLAVSTRVRELFVQNGADPARIRVLLQAPPQVDAIWERTGSRRAVVPELRRPLRVAFVGSCLPHKGVHVLAQALQLVAPGSVECVALGDVAPEYVTFLRGIDGRGALHLAGRYDQDRLPELLAAVDVVVVPSLWDDCAPLVVAEALAARAPVLGSRIGGIPDFVAHGTNGFLFAPGDAQRLARCLAAFTEDRALLGRMQQAIAPPRTFADYVDDLVAVYRELCRPHARGAATRAPAVAAR